MESTQVVDEPDASAQPDAGPGCVEGTVEVGACGLNGRGEVSRRCVDAAWVEDAPCVDPDQCVDAAVEAIIAAAATGKIGDGKVFISDLQEVVRIRTRETGEDAI